MYGYMKSDYLCHHGVKGQKWGVRRMDRMSGKQLHRKLKRQANKARKKYYEEHKNEPGVINTHKSDMAAGKESAKLLKKETEQISKYKNSKEYKDWDRKITKLNREEYKYNPDDFDKTFNKLMNQKPKLPKGTIDRTNSSMYLFKSDIKANGGKYIDKTYVNRGSYDLTKAIIKDLGYSMEDAEKFTKRMADSQLTLG